MSCQPPDAFGSWGLFLSYVRVKAHEDRHASWSFFHWSMLPLAPHWTWSARAEDMADLEK